MYVITPLPHVALHLDCVYHPDQSPFTKRVKSFNCLFNYEITIWIKNESVENYVWIPPTVAYYVQFVYNMDMGVCLYKISTYRGSLAINYNMSAAEKWLTSQLHALLHMWNYVLHSHVAFSTWYLVYLRQKWMTTRSNTFFIIVFRIHERNQFHKKRFS